MLSTENPSVVLQLIDEELRALHPRDALFSQGRGAPGIPRQSIWGFYTDHLIRLFDEIKGIALIIFKLIQPNYKHLVSCLSHLLLSEMNDLCVCVKTSSEEQG